MIFIYVDVVLSYMIKLCDIYGFVGVVYKDLYFGWRFLLDYIFYCYDGYYYNLYVFG